MKAFVTLIIRVTRKQAVYSLEGSRTKHAISATDGPAISATFTRQLLRPDACGLVQPMPFTLSAKCRLQVTFGSKASLKLPLNQTSVTLIMRVDDNYPQAQGKA